jgi:hypothetical protein
MGRTAWILLQLVTECHKVIVDATAARIAVSVTTDLMQQLCACDDPIGVLNEKAQSFELMCCQLDRRSEGDSICSGIVGRHDHKSDLCGSNPRWDS